MRNFVDGAEASARYALAGVVTPDHTIRTKNWPLIVPAPDSPGSAFKANVAPRSKTHPQIPRLLHDRSQRALRRHRQSLDPMPRVVLVPGLGCSGSAARRKTRASRRPRRGRDETITDAEATRPYQAIDEADLFDME